VPKNKAKIKIKVKKKKAVWELSGPGRGYAHGPGAASAAHPRTSHQEGKSWEEKKPRCFEINTCVLFLCRRVLSPPFLPSPPPEEHVSAALEAGACYTQVRWR